MDVAIMVEGQWGLNWPRWQRIARAVETLGFAGLYRSDHITNQEPPYQDSLELWVSLTWLADHTQHIAFGPLVSPVSLRHPVTTARMAGAVDDLSGGRLHLGLGAGWQEREHAGYGFDLLDVPRRLACSIATRRSRSTARFTACTTPFCCPGRNGPAVRPSSSAAVAACSRWRPAAPTSGTWRLSRRPPSPR